MADLANWKTWKLFHILFFITFVISGLVINSLQLISYLILEVIMQKPDQYRRINYYFVWAIYAQLLFVADWWSDSKLRLHRRPNQSLNQLGQEHSLIIMNHHYEVDWLIGWMAADRSGVLGNARVFVKRVLQYVPIVGWAWALSDVGFLYRDWDKDKDLIIEKVRKLEDYPDPAWLLLFAEGTRLSPEKLASGQQFSRDRGMTVLKHHLVPRTRGFQQIVENLDTEKIKVIYDVTIAVDEDKGCAATLGNVLNGKSVIGDLFVQRIEITDEIKKDPAKFLYDLYEQKDDLKDNYYKNKQFLDGEKVEEREKRPYSLILSLTLNVLTFFYLMNCFWSFSIIFKFVTILLIGLMNVGMEKMINITKIEKGSQYGSKKAN